ncbi:cysteine and glycine-rich protein 1-like [Lytechinus variegatus]|uniref:cysteine and glycine-rich protein 1-like n=1 Tax=Lytechinus variegatus TaxID=7654 RepID=UPI001BB1C85E|nr:cysteine and glycine-rich protein 1-like [Lytechinus variegatus]
MPSFGGGKKCARCGKSVYTAEEILAAGQSWHKSCFSCESCKKSLDSNTVSDKDGKIYCKACYGSLYGPTGYGYGGGAGALTSKD